MEVAARITLPIDQSPALAWNSQNHLLIHRAGQTGMRYPDKNADHPVRYTINAQGWNSWRDYPSRDYSHHLAVVIGDSFVEALQVAPSESVAERLWQQLPTSWSVYGMGISGAPLSQYVQMARYAEVTWHPDLIIFMLVHNDFIESYEAPDNRLYESFWHSDGHQMIMPKDYAPRFGSGLMSSSWATGRLAIQFFRPPYGPPTETWQMGIDVPRNLHQLALTRTVTDYLLTQIATLKSATLLVMDAPRSAIEQGENPHVSPVYELNRLVQQSASLHQLRLVDLTGLFFVDYTNHHQTMSFRTDYHWNARTHDLVARTLAPLVQHLP